MAVVLCLASRSNLRRAIGNRLMQAVLRRATNLHALFYSLPCWMGAHKVPAHRCKSKEIYAMTITAINMRNQFRGHVKEIIEGPVVSEVDVQTPSGLIVTSVITTRSVKELKLAVGKEVIALVKSTEVSIAAL
jgi:molybdopterin-binding protein